MEDEFRLVILFDFLAESASWRGERFFDTPNAILFQGCNEEMKKFVRLGGR
ncbi:hypothetical protein [Bradyrhizobium liaoningense]|uniref:hypothetical protein n=1 Tax=Bradyrhizobium liaoningense TaxID=43992 RepID=UPI001BA64396|nr:hypothetical protein [Bradyrhizobium liaoningense]MBR0816974.1 hypothetical protein [Bradyrhizobium liaoningense]